ncbi:MAG: NAD-dependent glutamate dehydrogenase [Tremellales sp. Tagirdzhanova-0007]|nr:MAG: NAD-dependent glutamate dehydrogenase [Tremellales sp. Tagirdzhanova-0007]
MLPTNHIVFAAINEVSHLRLSLQLALNLLVLHPSLVVSFIIADGTIDSLNREYDLQPVKKLDLANPNLPTEMVITPARYLEGLKVAVGEIIVGKREDKWATVPFGFASDAFLAEVIHKKVGQMVAELDIKKIPVWHCNPSSAVGHHRMFGKLEEGGLDIDSLWQAYETGLASGMDDGTASNQAMASMAKPEGKLLKFPDLPAMFDYETAPQVTSRALPSGVSKLFVTLAYAARQVDGFICSTVSELEEATIPWMEKSMGMPVIGVGPEVMINVVESLLAIEPPLPFVFRLPSGDASGIPEALVKKAELSGRGIFVGWAPQVKILQHKATGMFLVLNSKALLAMLSPTNEESDSLQPPAPANQVKLNGSATPGKLSRAPSDASMGRIRKDTIGYKTSPFPLKAAQQSAVARILAASGFLPQELVEGEVDWFYNHLGIDNTYFLLETPEAIADHVLALYSAKLLAYTKHDPEKLVIDLEKINLGGEGKEKNKEGAVFIHTSQAGVTVTQGPGATVEKRIDALFLNNSTPAKAFRLETYRSAGAISSTISRQLRCYFVACCSFPTSPPRKTPSGATEIRSVSDASFLAKASENTLEIYQTVMDEVETRDGAVIEMYEVEDSRERRLVIGYKMGGTSKFFSALSDLYHFYGLFSARKYVEQFANGITIISMYLNPVPNTRAPPIEHSIHQVVREASLLYCLPDNPFFTVSNDNESSHAVQEATYAYVGWIFAQHFCNRLGSAYLALKNVLDDSNPGHAEVINKIKTRFREDTFTRESIREVILNHPELMRMLYINFAMVHYPAADEASHLTPTLSFQRLKTEQPLSDEDLYLKIRKTAANQHALQILEALLIFNKHVLKCNFYQPTKVALSFRLNPDFLPEIEYPKKAFGMFFVVGAEFRGFHLRFRDVARGGIRIIRSRGKENYNSNVRTLFDENYALAATQNLKNKDIPEGGAKGTILPTVDANYRKCFEKYVDSIMDLLIPGRTPGIKGPIVDVSGRTDPEILFFGPDENTADLMDWAAEHARNRGATWWKSFTTGKSAEMLGGIPHDAYGMTSLSVRQYILGVLKSHGLNEKDVTKFQTGGPDGDLGSNEILLSKDKTIAIIDGSGVLYDPAGLDRPELIRLAKARQPVSNFSKDKLGHDGYQVLVDEQDVHLPTGEIVLDGVDFRNTFHFRVKADLFVPCGGRPEAVNLSNVSSLVDTEGKPNFKYVVEGANLFFTQQARLYLEKKGVELFKDSSTNKGGVTSSSLEVLAGLGLSDAEYLELMIFKDGKPSSFYQSYVRDIQQKVCENAAAEYAWLVASNRLITKLTIRLFLLILPTTQPVFDDRQFAFTFSLSHFPIIPHIHPCRSIAKDWQRNKGSKSRTIISDQLSSTLNDLQNELEVSDLYENVQSRKHVLARAIPRTLVDKVGLDTLMQRLPEQYQRAVWSAWVSSNYIYECSLTASNVDFFHFFSRLAL